jgi:peroxiredoxin Q/BCP
LRWSEQAGGSQIGGPSVRAIGFRDESERIATASGVVVGISPDPPATLARFHAKNSVPFVLLSDPEHVVLEQYEVWRQRKMAGRTFFGVVRSHFVLDESGKILDAQVGVSPAESVRRAVATLLGDP